jgi:hypothetical protein
MSSVNSVADSPPVEQQRVLLERILSSALFRKSHKLAAFLRFICEQQQMGKTDGIYEQRIGIEVFGRREGYHVGEDSIVRSQARLLRMRLEEFFASEGKDEQIVLTIPKGSYIPEFHFREPKSAEPAHLVEIPSAHLVEIPSTQAPPHEIQELPGPQTKSSSRFWMFAAFAGVFCLILLIGWRHWSARNMAGSTPAETRFWSDIFSAQRTTMIVPADSNLVLMNELSGSDISLADYMSGKYRSMVPPQGNARFWDLLISTQYTNIADLNLATQLQEIAGKVGGKTHIYFARDVNLSELKQNNVILIGATRANPWVELFQTYGSFRFGYDPQTHINFVYNRNPRPGELDRYEEVGTTPGHIAYGLIEYLPGLDKEGAALLVGGTTKAGTEAASEFLLSPQFDQFLHTIDTGQTLPHFELLLSTQNLSGSSYAPTIVRYHLLTDRVRAH